jgi:hypothetical protein
VSVVVEQDSSAVCHRDVVRDEIREGEGGCLFDEI